MGMLQDFTCPACGLNGHVSGGEDCGMLAATTTIYCESCDNLQDAVVVKDLFSIPPRRHKPRCGKSKSHPIKVWNHNELCPRCGLANLKVAENGLVTMWD
jgi:Zn finger protein HypA/HybF involved in hydrogenase expression